MDWLIGSFNVRHHSNAIQTQLLASAGVYGVLTFTVRNNTSAVKKTNKKLNYISAPFAPASQTSNPSSL